jgi:hypothetical protein
MYHESKKINSKAQQGRNRTQSQKSQRAVVQDS